jgi:hypothetical protein
MFLAKRVIIFKSTSCQIFFELLPEGNASLDEMEEWLRNIAFPNPKVENQKHITKGGLLFLAQKGRSRLPPFFSTMSYELSYKHTIVHLRACFLPMLFCIHQFPTES